MRPSAYYVADGQVIAFPAGTLPLRARCSPCPFDSEGALRRLARDHAALSKLRGAWRELGLDEQPIMLSDAGVVSALHDAVARRRLTFTWVPNGRASLKPLPFAEARTHDPPGSVSTWSKGDKIAAAFRRVATMETVDREIRRVLLDLVSPLSIGLFVGSILFLAAAHANGVGEAADLFLAGLAFRAAGVQGVIAIAELGVTTGKLLFAQTVADIDRAADDYADELTTLGVAFLTMFLTRAKPAGGGAAEEGPPSNRAASSAAKAERPAERGSSTPKQTQEAVAPKKNATSIAERKETARAFYEKAGWSESKIDDHLSGIDFSKDVSEVTLPKGTEVVQYSYPGKTGNYFAPPGTDPATLGINPAGRVETRFTLSEPVKVIRSTANDIPDWNGSGAILKGGGTQYFTPHSSAIAGGG